jgi:hypothetical protein
MGERREVMKVTVTWVTEDSEEVLAEALTYLDEHYVSPVDWVSQGLHVGAVRIDIETKQRGKGFEILVEGPEKWRAANDT